MNGFMKAKAITVKSVVKQSAEVQAADILRSQILTGAIIAGARLTEQQLSDDLAVSRATVRTALHQLSQEGLIIQIPYTGWTVVSLTSVDAWELYTLRASLESLAAKFAASSNHKIRRDALNRSMWTLLKASRGRDVLKAADADFALHESIVDLANHKRLSEQYRLVGQQIRMYIVSSDAIMPDLKNLALQHQPIVDAILNGEPLEAAQLAEAHNILEGENLVAHLKTLESQRKI
jgi:DNA-binding GntR family transcriptional regulator